MFKAISGVLHTDGNNNFIQCTGNSYIVTTNDRRTAVFDSFLKCMNFINSK